MTEVFGRLRARRQLLLGDLRMALASLRESEWGLTWRDARAAAPGYEWSPMGTRSNLLISGLWQLLDDPVEGLDWVGRSSSVRRGASFHVVDADRHRGGYERRRPPLRRVRPVWVAVAPGTVG